MGQQSGTSKPGSPPNPNYGSGSGVDNSNGTYNAGVQGAAPLASPALTPPAGTTNTATTTASAQVQPYSGSQKAPGSNKAGQPPAPAGGASMTADAALAANPRPPEYSSYDGQDHTAPPTATQLPATPTTAAPPPMQGGAIQQLANSKMQSKGQQPPQQGGMIGGMANAATGNAVARDPNDPFGTKARAAQGQANYDASPQWMKNVLGGVDASGGTNESRGAANTGYQGEMTQDWEGLVKKISGESDPWEAMRKMAAVSRDQGQKGWDNVRRSLENSGLDPLVGARLSEMFGTGGGDAESAARRLGVLDEYRRRGGMKMRTGGYNPADYAGQQIAATPITKTIAGLQASNAWAPGTPNAPLTPDQLKTAQEQLAARYSGK